MVKQESQRRDRALSAPVRSLVSSTVVQKQVGQTMVQLPQLRQRSATSSQRLCSRLRISRSRTSSDRISRPIDAAAAVVERAAASLGRAMQSDDVRDLLMRNLEHRRWDQVADRCLSCGNCTMVCPTCFCTTVEETSGLTGAESARSRRWDSCFTMDFSYIHGGSVRSSTRSRYRQWMTHKLATWHDQFDMSGCVGCGRCITWCPVGIDITEEVRAIRDDGPN
jgi:ferredoxin